MNPVEATVDAAVDEKLDAAQGNDAATGSDAATVHDLRVGTVRGRLIFDKKYNRVNVAGVSCGIGFVGVSATTLTDDHGDYSLDVPPNPSLVLLAPLSGDVAVQRVLANPISAAVDLHVLDIDAYVGSVSRVHGNFDMFDHGAVAVRFVGSSRGGYGAALSATHGGAFVFSAAGFANPVESSSTLIAGDTIYFYAVDPGTTTLALTSPSGLAPCRDSYAPETTQYPVLAGTMTEIVLSCP